MNLSVRVGLQRDGFDLDVDFELTADVTALFGPSGAGKTTLLHAIAGLVKPPSGRIALGNRVLMDDRAGVFMPPPRRRVGVLFQDLRLFPHMDAESNLLFGYRNLPAAERRLAPKDVIDTLELSALLRRRPGQLSGGERQRVALGRTLLAMPDLLLMDEPLAALDLRLRRQILPYLRWVHERLSIPILYVSHSLSEVLELTDQVVVLDGGRVTGQGEVFDVLGHALSSSAGLGDDPFSTASLLPVVAEHVDSGGDFVRGHIGGQEVMLPFADLPVGSTGRVALRPEDVMLATAPLRNVSARNQLRATVERISPLHGRLLVHLKVGPDAVIRAELTRAAQGDLGVEIGAEFYCVVKTSALQWQ